MIRVCFYGDLRQYGRRFDLQAVTPAEALHALFTQIKGLRQHIQNGIYQVRWRGQDQSADSIENIFRRPESGVLHIVPRVAGAGKRGGVVQTVLGVVLIVVGAFTNWAGGSYLIQAGIGLVLGGVAQMLTKQPRLDISKGVEASRNTAFSNLDNTSAQGRPVPLAYGLVYCGSRVISQGVESRRINTGNGKNDAVQRYAGISKLLPDLAINYADEPPGKLTAADLTMAIDKVFRAGKAAMAPNGKKYNTDFENDSVRARNYTATYTVNRKAV